METNEEIKIVMRNKLSQVSPNIRKIAFWGIVAKFAQQEYILANMLEALTIRYLNIFYPNRLPFYTYEYLHYQE